MRLSTTLRFLFILFVFVSTVSAEIGRGRGAVKVSNTSIRPEQRCSMPGKDDSVIPIGGEAIVWLNAPAGFAEGVDPDDFVGALAEKGHAEIRDIDLEFTQCPSPNQAYGYSNPIGMPNHTGVHTLCLTHGDDHANVGHNAFRLK